MRKIFFFPLFFIYFLSFCRTSDSLFQKKLSFSFNVIPLLINELSFYLDYNFAKATTAVLSLGYISRNKKFADYGNSEKNIGSTVYEGVITRFHLKHYSSYELMKSKIKRKYIAIQGVYKYLFYNHYTFEDRVGVSEDCILHFTRSETMHVIGADFFIGKEILKSRSHFEYYFGLGFRSRNRNFITHEKKSKNSSCSGNIPLGEGSDMQIVPALIFG